ncbi:hypothetical protein ACN3VN_07045 [Xylella fastidiosa]|nr:hypothetical protein [Xylella fastidiosa]
MPPLTAPAIAPIGPPAKKRKTRTNTNTHSKTLEGIYITIFQK